MGATSSRCPSGLDRLPVLNCYGELREVDHDPWLVSEVRRLTGDLAGLHTNLELVPLKFRLGFTDDEAVVVIGQGEWRDLIGRVTDAREEIIRQLNDFIDNEFHRQLHWSALRMLTAAGVLGTELAAFHGRLKFIASRPGDHTGDVVRLIDWFEGQLLPVSERLSTRLLQFIARVLDPASWQVSGTLGGADLSNPLQLSMTFHPNTELRWRQQREKERRLERIRVD